MVTQATTRNMIISQSIWTRLIGAIRKKISQIHRINLKSRNNKKKKLNHQDHIKRNI